MVNTYFPPWRGGAETYVYNVSRNLVKLGHQVEVFCASNPLKPGKYFVDNVTVHRFKPILFIYGVPITFLPLRLLKGKDFDIIHSNFPNPFTAVSTALASLLHEKPCVLTWHNDLIAVTRFAGYVVWLHDNLFAAHYLRYFKKIIATTKIYVKSSSLLRKCIEKVVVVPNGVDCERCNPSLDPEPVKEKYSLWDKKVILFVGALTKWHRYKGLEYLLEALKKVVVKNREAQLLIVGEGYLKQHYVKLCRELGIKENVCFAGDVPDNELPIFYAAADIVVLPSIDKSEGCGLTLLEANASGRPVIGSKVGGIPEIIRHGVNGLLVPPKNPEELYRAINLLLNDDEKRIKMGREGRKITEKRDWPRVTRKLEEMYREIVEETG